MLCCIVFIFSCLKAYFYFYYLIVNHSPFSNVLFILSVFVYFSIFFVVNDFLFYTIVVREDDDLILIIFNTLRLNLCLTCGVSLRLFSMHLRGTYILLWDEVFCKYQLNPSCPVSCLRSLLPH